MTDDLPSYRTLQEEQYKDIMLSIIICNNVKNSIASYDGLVKIGGF